MVGILQGSARTKMKMPAFLLVKGIGWGMVAGLAGTLVMDLVLMGMFVAAGMPALTCFSIVGDTIAHVLSLLGVTTTGGVLLGMAAHYLIGPVIGGIYGAAAANVEMFQADTPGKNIRNAVLYTEILSQPMLAMTPIFLGMTAAEIWLWFGGSFVMHAIWGCILGVVVGYGLRFAPAANHKG